MTRDPMQVEKVAIDSASVSFSPDELLILNNALNEVCHGLDSREFETRIGAEQSAVHSLLATIGTLCDQMNLSVR